MIEPQLIVPVEGKYRVAELYRVAEADRKAKLERADRIARLERDLKEARLEAEGLPTKSVSSGDYTRSFYETRYREFGYRKISPEGFTIQQVLSLQGDQINPSSLVPFGSSINLGELRFTLESSICADGLYKVNDIDVEFGSETLYVMCKGIVEEGKRHAQQAQAPYVAVTAQMVTAPFIEIPLNNPIQTIDYLNDSECGSRYKWQRLIPNYPLSTKESDDGADLKEKSPVLIKRFLMSPTAQLYVLR